MSVVGEAPGSREEPDIFKQPVCLIATDKDGQLQVNEDALRQLEDIPHAVNVVAIAGRYRTGKSYLLNRLAGGHKAGFPLGSTIQSETKGIWVWCRKHPVHEDQTLVLLDTEGLGDVNKGDVNHDHWIFAIATLLSSTLVYNMIGVLDQGTIETLNFVTEMSKHIKTRESDSGNEEFDMYFPAFIVTLRDFSLKLELNGKKISADEYLENVLELRPETNEQAKKINKPRRCIRRYFKSRKCFTFDRPAETEQLENLETLEDADLKQQFVDDAEVFCRYVCDNCASKKLDTGAEVNGRMFASFVKSYVGAIRNGAIPCIENALNTMAKQENGKAIEQALKLYSEKMNESVKLPTDNDDVLSTAHHEAVKEAVAVFMKKVIYDEDNSFQRKLNDEMDVTYSQWKKRNEEVSMEKTQEVLDNLNKAIAEKLKKGEYMCNGGYSMYQVDLRQLQTEFDSVKGLGVKANYIFLEFLKKKFEEGESILAMDKKLTEEEKKVEAEKQKKIEALRKQEMGQREKELIAKHAEDVRRIMKENLEQLEKKRKEELENLKKHHDKIILSRLEEQKRELQEGFEQKASKFDGMMEKRFEQMEKKRKEELETLQNIQKELISSLLVENEKKRQEEVVAMQNSLKELILSFFLKESNDKQEELIEKALSEQHMESEIKKVLAKVQMKSHDDGIKLEALQKEVDEIKSKSCFADSSLVRVKTEDGKVRTVHLSELKVGDSVESFDFKTNQVIFSRVYFITHSAGPSTYGYPLLSLELEGGNYKTRLRLDQNHLVYAAPGDVTPSHIPDLPVRANKVKVGDVLWVRQGKGLVTKKVTCISDVKAGIRHPMTMNHVIIVDNVLASVHMHYERIYRALTSPLRLLYAVSPAVVQSDFVTGTVNAFDYVEKFL